MPFKHNASPRHLISCARYRVTNWPAYEAGLRRRGASTLWLDEAALDGAEAGSTGGQPRYSECAIEVVLTLRLVFHLALRQAGAFGCCLLRLLGSGLTAAPEFSRASARLVHLVLDSTGLELFGQGEWDVERHGRVRQQWRKLHLAVDAETGVIGHTC